MYEAAHSANSMQTAPLATPLGIRCYRIDPAPVGAAGATGPGSISQFSESILLTTDNTPLDDVVTITVRCANLNSKALGGGYATGVEGDKSDEITVNAAFPIEASGNDPDGYRVKFTRTNTNVTGNIVVSAFVNCTP